MHHAHPGQTLIFDSEQVLVFHLPGTPFFEPHPSVLWANNAAPFANSRPYLFQPILSNITEHVNCPKAVCPKSQNQKTQQEIEVLGGNEVGDTHLRELHIEDNYAINQNHTPYLFGRFASTTHYKNHSLLGEFKFLQNDHSSFKRAEYRQNTIHPSKEASFFGANYPPRSQIESQILVIRTHTLDDFQSFTSPTQQQLSTHKASYTSPIPESKITDTDFAPKTQLVQEYTDLYEPIHTDSNRYLNPLYHDILNLKLRTGTLWTPSLLSGQEYPWRNHDVEIYGKYNIWEGGLNLSYWESLHINDLEGQRQLIHPYFGLKVSPKNLKQNFREIQQISRIDDLSLLVGYHNAQSSGTSINENNSFLYTSGSLPYIKKIMNKIYLSQNTKFHWNPNYISGSNQTDLTYQISPSQNIIWGIKAAKGDETFFQGTLSEISPIDSSKKLYAKSQKDLWNWGTHIFLSQKNFLGYMTAQGHLGWEANSIQIKTDSLYSKYNTLFRDARQITSGEIKHALQVIFTYHPTGLNNSWIKTDIEQGNLFENPPSKFNPEFQASPWWLTFRIASKFPNGLLLKLQSHLYGPRKIWGWGNPSDPQNPYDPNQAYTLPTQWENNLLVEQMLWGKMTASYSAQYLFKDELLEHPAGNPLRFRIIIGLKAVW